LLWTGDVDNHWGTNQLGNTNWAFDLLPHNGDSLIFPSSSPSFFITNNLNALVINNITLSHVAIEGNAITLTGNVLDNNTNAGFSDDLLVPIALSAGTHMFTINSSSSTSPGSVNLGALNETGGPASLVVQGPGGLVYRSANTYTGTTTLNGSNLLLFNSSGVSIPGDLVINDCRVLELGGPSPIADTANVTVNSRGTLDLDGHFDRVGSLHVASGGVLSLDGSNQGDLQANSVTLDDGAFLTMVIGRPAPQSDDVIVSFGPVHVGGILAVRPDTNDHVGAAFPFIENLGNQPVSGTFDDLPQGGIYDIDGHLFTINYAGGAGNNDVVLTRRANVNVTSTRINDGSAQRSRVTSLTLTFSDPVDFSITPGTAFTLVRNTDGAIVTFDATPAIVNGVTVVTLNNFGGNATQFGSLADGRYTLTALASQISYFDEPLDGNRDGTGGDDFTFFDFQGLYCMFGDLNGDQTVNGFDLGLFRNAFGAQTGDPNFLSYLDFNGDGVINGFDLGQFRTRFGTMLP
jgi:hypothetical protein